VTTQCTIVGNCTKDPELRYTNSGMPVASFSVAVNERTKNPAGEWVDGEASYYDVTCFRLLAESVSEAVSRGDRVVVVGKMKQSRWDAPDGAKRSKVEVVADDVGRSILWAAKDNEPSGRQPVTATVSDTDPF
jgi:single-strand DNA-binding protein